MLPNIFVISKKGYYLLDEKGKAITSSDGKVLTFSNKESAELYLKENNIKGTVK